jgi:hypothetical protein
MRPLPSLDIAEVPRQATTQNESRIKANILKI